jgi:ATP-dependent Clp protease adapter protein ClpS
LQSRHDAAFSDIRPAAGALPGALLFRHTSEETPPPPAGRIRPPADSAERFAVRVMDNPVNTYQQVMEVCSQALGIAFDAAFDIACTIDQAGSCVVCVGPRTEAERVANHIATIGIEVRLEPVAGPAAGS